MSDKNLYWTGLVYFIGSFLLGAAWWQAVLLGLAMALVWHLNYARRTSRTVGVFVLMLGLCVWMGFLPAPARWGQIIVTIQR